MAQEDATIRFILEDASGGGPGREAGQYPGMSKGETESWLFGKIQPPPPPPPSSPPFSPTQGTGIQPGLQQLTTAIQGLTQITGGPAPPVIPPPSQRPTPPPAPPPIQTPPPGDPSLLQRMAGMIPQSALPSFVGSIAARATGSATVGGLAGTAAGSIMSGLSATGAGLPIAATLAGVALAGTALVETFQKLRGVASELTDSIREFSPHVAGATATAEVRTIMMRLRRAERIGPELGAFVGAESRLETAVGDFKTTVMKDIVPKLTALINLQTAVVKVSEKSYKFVAEEVGPELLVGLDASVRFLPLGLRELYVGVRLLGKIAGLFEGKGEDDRAAAEDFFDNFLNPFAPKEQGAAGRGRSWPVGMLGGGF